MGYFDFAGLYNYDVYLNIIKKSNITIIFCFYLYTRNYIKIKKRKHLKLFPIIINYFIILSYVSLNIRSFDINMRPFNIKYKIIKYNI